METWIIISIVVVLLFVWMISIYNNLVKLRNNRENAFANIDVQLKQRHDLIPQLVATVKGYADHEKEVFQRVTEARAAAMNATGINEKVQTENALTSALTGLRVSLEAYPELKSQPELSAITKRDFGYREQAGSRSSLLQFSHTRTQQCRTDIPFEYSCQYVRLPHRADV